jgi:hypothetical protein
LLCGDRVRLLTVAFACLLGCGAAHPPTPPPPVTPAPTSESARLELGGADAMGHWLALTDGEDVTLVEGAQGGFHVWLKYRVEGMTPGSARLDRTAHRLADDALVLRTTGQATLGEPDASGVFEIVDPIPMFMCPSPIGLSVIDQPIVFRLEFPDAGIARDITLVPHCPTDANNEFCLRICTG